MTATFLTTVTGRQVDLYQPRVEDIAFEDIAEHPAQEPRLYGATPGKVYSVAEHLVLGCDWILAGELATEIAAKEGMVEFGFNPPIGATPEERLLASCYLCHDFHEAYLKDD